MCEVPPRRPSTKKCSIRLCQAAMEWPKPVVNPYAALSRNQDPERKFEFRTPLAVGTLAVSGTTGRRMGGKCGTLPGLFSG
jgi:hypothetical protein